MLSSCPSPLPTIVVQATAMASNAGTGAVFDLAPASVSIPLSADQAADSALAVAQRSEPCAFSYLDEFPVGG